jgi:DNA-binding CsgD family transcriptional regulator
LKRLLIYGVTGGVLIALLKVIEFQYFVRAYPAEVYGGIVAVIFTALGLYAGKKHSRPRILVKEVPVEVRVEVPVARDAGFTVNEAKLKELAITPREYEILLLIAEGLSNREIGQRLFVSENTVKSHSSRLFEKMDVSRRGQAVQKGRELGLIA